MRQNPSRPMRPLWQTSGRHPRCPVLPMAAATCSMMCVAQEGALRAGLRSTSDVQWTPRRLSGPCTATSLIPRAAICALKDCCDRASPIIPRCFLTVGAKEAMLIYPLPRRRQGNMQKLQYTETYRNHKVPESSERIREHVGAEQILRMPKAQQLNNHTHVQRLSHLRSTTPKKART